MALVMVCLLAANAIGMGVSPAKTFLLAEETPPTLAYQGTFWVINNEHQELVVTVSVSGELSQYVTLGVSELRFREDHDALPVPFAIQLPANIRPGESTASIIVEQVLEEEEEEEKNKEKEGDKENKVISSKIVLKHKIIAQGAYPDKYVQAKLNFHESGNEIRMVSEVKNLGQQDLEKVQTKFYVNDKKQQEQVLETETTSLKKKENKLLDTSVTRDLFQLGEFEVRAVTLFDGQQVEISKKLLVGKPEVEVTYFDPYFIAFEINKYTLELLNKWNTLVENVFVDIEVKKDGQKIDSFRTKSVDIDKEARKRLQDYFDARNKNPGSYSFEMVVNFWDTYRMSSKTFQSELLPREIVEKAQQEGAARAISGEAVLEQEREGEKGKGWKKMAGWILAGIIAGSLILFGIYRYRHRQEYEGGDEAL